MINNNKKSMLIQIISNFPYILIEIYKFIYLNSCIDSKYNTIQLPKYLNM